MHIPEGVHQSLIDFLQLQIKSGSFEVVVKRRLEVHHNGEYDKNFDRARIAFHLAMSEKVITLFHEFLHSIYGDDEEDEDTIEEAALLMFAILSDRELLFFERVIDAASEHLLHPRVAENFIH